MRLFFMPLLLLASSASAQSPAPVDCDAVRNSKVPVALTYHEGDGTSVVAQAYPDKPGDYVVWTRRTLPSTRPTPPVFVTKAIFADGLPASAEMWTTYAGKDAHRTGTYTTDGLPRNFDRRSDVSYKMHGIVTPGGASSEETMT